MRGSLRPFVVVVAALAAGAAFAAEWSPWAGVFPSNPCQDGWSACLAGGAAVNSGPARDTAGRPIPSDHRVSWFDLQPTSAFSPFVGLSPYVPSAGPSPVAAVEAVQAPAPSAVAEPVAAADVAPSRATDAAPSQAAAPAAPVAPAAAPQQVAVVTPPAPVPAPTAPAAPAKVAQPAAPVAAPVVAPPPTVAAKPSTPAPAPVPSAPPQTVAAKPVAAVVAPPPVTPPPAAVSASAATASAAAASAPANDSCDDLVKLEPAAMMGQLRPGQVKCLDGRVASEGAQTARDKVSRLLIANAESGGNKAEWERLMRRHLEDIDRSDPDMCFKYALHLSRGGASKSLSVIKWADYALDNKSKWTGNTYKQRVTNLYKLRAEAMIKLWQDAEAQYTSNRSDENEQRAGKFRGTARDYSREWLDYARSSGQDTKTALAACMSAASGNRAFCEGG
ncbi:MAG: hypothetical protein RLZZ299_3124 [Pseudomonadota bacterium]